MTSIAAETRMRSVTLDVADLELVTSFYAEGVGLNIVGEKPGGMRSLGRDNNVLINLRHSPALKHAGPSDAGLFHTALLFDNKAFLAASVVNVAQLFPVRSPEVPTTLLARLFISTIPRVTVLNCIGIDRVTLGA